MNYIAELKEVIRRLHGTESTHVEIVPIKETHAGQTVWESEVEVFDLHDHPQTSRCTHGRMKRTTQTTREGM